MLKQLRTLAIAAVLLSSVPIVVGLVAAQDDAPADAARVEALEQRIAVLEEQVAALQASVAASNPLLAEVYLDAAGFHAMDEALHDGELDPRFLATVQATRAAIGALALPEALHAARDAFMAASAELEGALQAQDVAAAAAAAERVHARQHDLSHAVLDHVGGAGDAHGDAQQAAGGDDPVARGDTEGDADPAGEAAGAPDLPEGVEPFAIALAENGGPVDGVQTHRVARGDTVALVLRSAVAGELHLHGYDLEWALDAADIVATFEAPTAGRFPLEFHPEGGESGIVVAYLEVHP